MVVEALFRGRSYESVVIEVWPQERIGGHSIAPKTISGNAASASP